MFEAGSWKCFLNESFMKQTVSTVSDSKDLHYWKTACTSNTLACRLLRLSRDCLHFKKTAHQHSSCIAFSLLGLSRLLALLQDCLNSLHFCWDFLLADRDNMTNQERAPKDKQSLRGPVEHCGLNDSSFYYKGGKFAIPLHFQPSGNCSIKCWQQQTLQGVVVKWQWGEVYCG